MNLNLVKIRNELRNNRCSYEMKSQLEAISNNLDQSNNPFYEVIKQALSNALEDIANNKFESASYQINFIHNMPLSSVKLNKWDEDHFYEFELPVFFENTEGVSRIKKMIILLSRLKVGL